MRKKLVLAGDSGVGKTSIFITYIKSINEPSCVNNVNTQSTIGASYDTIKVGKAVVGVWDTAGQERYRCLCSMYFRDVDMCMLVFDVTNRKSYNSLTYWIEQIPKDKDVALIFLANKTDTDRSKWTVSDQDIKIIEKYGQVIMTSAVNRSNFDVFKDCIIKKFSDSFDHTESKDSLYLPDASYFKPTYCCY